jgi:hypothetical protein
MKNILTLVLNIICLPAIATYILTCIFLYITLLKFNADLILRPKKMFGIFDMWLQFCEKTYFTIAFGALLWYIYLQPNLHAIYTQF